MALKLIACILLLEITTFLRECYRTLPRPTKAQTRCANFWGELKGPLHKTTGGGAAATTNTSSESTLNPASASGRRWSMAAQSIASGTSGGQQQGSQQLQQPPSTLQPSGSSELSTLSPSATQQGLTATSPAPNDHARKISFVLQEDIQTFNSGQSTLAAPSQVRTYADPSVTRQPQNTLYAIIKNDAETDN